MDVGYPSVAGLYFCLLVLMGAFFLINLVLAVIMNSFDQVDQAQEVQD
jgi:uncharacterized membrane protein